MVFEFENKKEKNNGKGKWLKILENSKRKIKKIKNKVPKNQKMLSEFEKEFEITFNFIENLLNQNTKLREARDILLPKLMNGQIEVQSSF